MRDPVRKKGWALFALNHCLVYSLGATDALVLSYLRRDRMLLMDLHHAVTDGEHQCLQPRVQPKLA